MPELTQAEYDTLLPHASNFLETKHAEIFEYEEGEEGEKHEIKVYLIDKGVRWRMEAGGTEMHQTFKVLAPTITKDEFLRERFQDFLTENLLPVLGDTYRFHLLDYVYANEFYVNSMCFAYETGFLSYTENY